MSRKQIMGTLIASIVVTLAAQGSASAQEQQPVQPAYPENPPPPSAYPTSPAPPPSAYPTNPAPQPGAYPPASAYPPPNAYPQQYQPQQMEPPRKSHPIRDLFVGTLAAVIQAATGGAVNSITQGVTGSITNWFDRKARKNGAQFAQQSYYPPATTTDPYAAAAQYPQQPYPQDPAQQYPAPTYPSSGQQYPTTTYPSADGQYPAAAYPSSNYPSSAQQYPSSSYPADQSGQQSAAYPAYPQDPAAQYPGYSTASYATSPQVYDPSTGQMVDASSSPYASAGTGTDGTLYAGFAYEVHAMTGSSSVPINAATHQFRSGERFMVHFRPSMPGRMDVFNINPSGQQTRIDSVSVAAGQLTSLGPYEFAGTKGSESLRLVLAPCSTPQLLTQTRDIVNVAQPASGGVALSNCSVVSRSLDKVRTRDIKKVAVDGGINYALDPVSQSELSTGQVAAREVTIVFHHN